MKKHIKQLVSLCVVVAVAVSCLAISAAAITWDNVEETKYATRYWSSDYATGKFYKNMTQIPLTGDGRRDVVAVAASQMGYIEGSSSSGYDGETGGSLNYTEYGYYVGLSGGSSHAWCAAFCAWSFYTAEVTDVDGGSYDTNSGNIWADTYVPDWSNYLISQGRYYAAYQFRNSYSSLYDASYVPQPGDLVFFYTASGDYPGWEGHIGLVAYSDGTYVYTLEGNTSSQDGVESEGGGAFFKKYSLTGSNLVGFGSMPYTSVEGLPEIDYSGANPTPGLYVTVSGAKSVYADKNDSTATSTLPMSSVFEVIKIEEASDGATMLYSKCEINGSTVYGWVVHGNDTNGYTKTLQVYASGEAAAPAPKLESDVYNITQNNLINGISANTTVSTLIDGLTTDGTLKAYKGNTELSSSTKLGTGMEIDLIDEDGDVVSTYTIVVKGDVNGDAKVNGFDYVLLKRHILKTTTLDGAYYDAGAVINGKKISAFDYIMIKRYVLGNVSF